MNHKLAFLVVLLVLVLGGLLYFSNHSSDVEENRILVVKTVIESFGHKLQSVSLLAPTLTLAESLEVNYKDLVFPGLIEAWKKDPTKAPGRLTSSPWPDRIEISEIKKVSDTKYSVKGDIVEVTNEAGGESVAALRPILLDVEKIGDRWLIMSVLLGSYPGDGNWQYSSTTFDGISFLYPIEFTTKYISAHAWPPIVGVSTSTFTCVEEESVGQDGLPVKKISRTVDDRIYCVESETGAAAGSAYTAYTYKTIFGGKLISLKFTLRYPQCANYNENQKTECEHERETFDLDGVVDRIISSIRLP